MLHSGDLVKIELILVVEQETPPLYLWKAPNRLKIGKYKLQEEKRKLEMQIKALNEVNQDKN